MTRPLLVTTRDELQTARASLPGRVAVVMTMGALHGGHVRLIDVARERADSVVVTIFVNPLQFAPGEDLQRYPRDLDTDVAVCAGHGVDVVFAPDVESVYPAGEPVVALSAGELGGRLEGASRPTHFDGVLTVVARMFELVTPDLAVFGEKDAQQLELIRRMVAEQGRQVEIVAVGIVRAADGLALSSRNGYLDEPGRVAALALSQALRAGAERAADGAAAVRAQACQVLAQTPGIEIDYVEVIDERNWDEPDERTRQARLLVAARVGAIRLIDNVCVVLGSQHRSDRPDPSG